MFTDKELVQQVKKNWSQVFNIVWRLEVFIIKVQKLFLSLTNVVVAIVVSRQIRSCLFALYVTLPRSAIGNVKRSIGLGTRKHARPFEVKEQSFWRIVLMRKKLRRVRRAFESILST